MNETMIREIVSQIVGQYLSQGSGSKSSNCMEIPAEASGRHVHLSDKDIERLFGEGHKLTPKKAVSQPGQYVSEERVTIVGPKNKYVNVAVLGPPRKSTQVEISQTDAMFLGIDAPVSMSGDLSGAADIEIVSDKGQIKAQKCTIIAKNHLHMSSAEAAEYGLKDGDVVDITMMTERPITFNKVLVRAGEGHKLALHIDYDEANACRFKKGDKGLVSHRNIVTGKTCECKDQGNSLSEGDVVIGTHYLSEAQVKSAVTDGCVSIAIKKGTVVSPLAKDYASKCHVAIRSI